MKDPAKYLISPFVVCVSIAGLLAGGAWVWAGTALVLALLVIDIALPRDFSRRDPRYPALYDTVIIFTVLLGFVQIAVLAWQVGRAGWTTGTILSASLNAGLIGFVPITAAIHELFHRRSPWQRVFGRWSQMLILDPLRERTHVVTHHLHVATPNDPDTARRGDNLYAFLPRSLAHQMLDAWKLDRMVCAKRGVGMISQHGMVFRAVLAVAAFLIAAAVIGGGWVAPLCVAGACLIPRVSLEIFNYVGHYGLVTEHPGRFAPRHTWNHLSPLVRVLSFEITNHAGHHVDSYKPFYLLEPDRSRIAAAAVLRPGVNPATVDLATVRTFLESRIARYKHPRQLMILDQLPRTPTGKVVRGVLIEAAEREAAPATV